jgi:hypothetical protein
LRVITLSRKVLGTGRSHKPDRVAFDSLFRNPHGPSIRSDDCIRIAGVFLCACTLFRFVDILVPINGLVPRCSSVKRNVRKLLCGCSGFVNARCTCDSTASKRQPSLKLVPLHKSFLHLWPVPQQGYLSGHPRSGPCLKRKEDTRRNWSNAKTGTYASLS